VHDGKSWLERTPGVEFERLWIECRALWRRRKYSAPGRSGTVQNRTILLTGAQGGLCLPAALGCATACGGCQGGFSHETYPDLYRHNLAVILVLSVVLRLLGVDRILDEQGIGLDLTGLLAFAAVFGFGGALVSLAMSKWTAKRLTGARVIATP